MLASTPALSISYYLMNLVSKDDSYDLTNIYNNFQSEGKKFGILILQLNKPLSLRLISIQARGVILGVISHILNTSKNVSSPSPYESAQEPTVLI